MDETSVIDINNLCISFKNGSNELKVVNSISFCVKQNSILGIVGESGSGKSITSLSLMGLLPKHKCMISGEAWFEGGNLLEKSDKEFQKLRATKIAMVFQEPMSSLNPTVLCGKQVFEVLKLHSNLSKKDIKNEVLALFEKVKLPRTEEIYHSYPHQISGGQKQRVMIAMALACKPQLLIADEPTTALDVTVQKEIVLLLKELQKETGMSILFISHDLSLVSEIADEVLVMKEGSVVEYGNVKDVFLHPKEDYTKALIQSRPSIDKRLKVLPTVKDITDGVIQEEEYTSEQRKKFHQRLYFKEPLLTIQSLEKHFFQKGFWFTPTKTVKAVNNVSFNVFEGETLGLVGESGCGKTTLGRTLLQLEKATGGKVFYRGKDISKLSVREAKKLRKDIQIIFQDPFSSLNPRITVGEAIIEPMKVHSVLSSNKERKKHVFNLLKKVGLQEEYYDRYPHEFSGGQRQRIGIARAIALHPKIIICDESVSALDVSVQAQVLNLLNELKEEFGFTYVFISHDLKVVKYMSDQLVVMNQGKIEEIGDADDVYQNPKSPYTQTLIEAIPKGIS